MNKVNIFTTLISMLVLMSCTETEEATFTFKGHIDNAANLEHVLLANGSGTVDTFRAGCRQKFPVERQC